jgi:hypothetical protein
VLTPDRKPDLVKTAPMADEIPLANVVRFEREGLRWRARIGPKDSGLSCLGTTPFIAVVYLMAQCEGLHWPFDDGWRDRLS